MAKTKCACGSMLKRDPEQDTKDYDHRGAIMVMAYVCPGCGKSVSIERRVEDDREGNRPLAAS